MEGGGWDCCWLNGNIGLTGGVSAQLVGILLVFVVADAELMRLRLGGSAGLISGAELSLIAKTSEIEVDGSKCIDSVMVCLCRGERLFKRSVN